MFGLASSKDPINGIKFHNFPSFFIQSLATTETIEKEQNLSHMAEIEKNASSLSIQAWLSNDSSRRHKGWKLEIFRFRDLRIGEW